MKEECVLTADMYLCCLLFSSCCCLSSLTNAAWQVWPLLLLVKTDNYSCLPFWLLQLLAESDSASQILQPLLPDKTDYHCSLPSLTTTVTCQVSLLLLQAQSYENCCLPSLATTCTVTSQGWLTFSLPRLTITVAWQVWLPLLFERKVLITFSVSCSL